jgi:hypothetical protein
MVAAECRLRQVQDPFSDKKLKRNKCPAGKECLILDPNFCPLGADTCIGTTDGYKYAYYKTKVF